MGNLTISMTLRNRSYENNIVEKSLYNDYSFSCALIKEIDLDVPAFFFLFFFGGGGGGKCGNKWDLVSRTQ